jgi:leader peptidase (prepilin peptidase)/N-methyltransferase
VLEWSVLLNWLFPILAAPLIGSFVGVVAARFPHYMSALFGRSACPQCGHRLAAGDLVPILSWILQGRRCRYCDAPIEWFYPLIEVGAILVAVSAAGFFSGWLLWVSCAFGWALLTIAAIDYRWMILPNELTLPLIPAGLCVHFLLSPDHVASYVIGALAGFAAFSIISWFYHRIRGRVGLGGGDAKLLAASGAWVSTSGLPTVVFLAATTALLMVIAAMLVGRRFSSSDKVPFGTFLCLGTWLVWLVGPLLLSAASAQPDRAVVSAVAGWL